MDIRSIDKDFNEAMFITKVNNIFIMLYTSIMMDDLDRVRHFISDNLEKKYELILKELKEKHLRQMYDELNVKDTNITNIEIKDNKICINVKLISRYMDYKVDEKFNVVSGDNTRRVENINYLTLEKTINSGYNSSARKCPGCGANISVNTSGKCEYCGSIFDIENYDWVLTSIEM